MAITNGYLTLSEARSFILPSGAGTDDDVNIELAVEAASRAIDEFCRRRFYSASETRYFTASGPSRLDVDDLVSVSTLKTDAGGDGTFETTWSSSDYNLSPYNANTDGRPYTRIERAPSGSYSFPTVARGVEIVGTFGWPSVPTAVKQACALQTHRLFKRGTEAPMGIAGLSVDGGGMRLMSRLDPDVELLVKPYRRLLVA